MKPARKNWREVQPSDPEYVAYLKSAQWRSKRKRLIALRWSRCEVCAGADDLHLHHLTYARLYDEHDTDLAVICRGCHAAVHGTWGVVRAIGAERHEAATRRALIVWRTQPPVRTTSAPSKAESVPWGKDAEAVAWADDSTPSLKDRHAPRPSSGFTRLTAGTAQHATP